VQTKTISWSVGKSFVSALAGIAFDEGKITSLDDPAKKYVPSLTSSAYGNVTIRNLLKMSSGIKFDENYFDMRSDINSMSRYIALGYDFDIFIAQLQREREQGLEFKYISTDTQVLGMVVQGAINQSLTSYLEQKIWKHIGVECDLFWLMDNDKSQRELYFGTINTCTRDFARFGWLYLNKGLSPLDSRRLISEKWVDVSTSKIQSWKIGYGYHWWIPNGIESEYLAMGVYGQYIYIAPKYNIVIAMNSANPNYSEKLDLQAIELFRAMVNNYVSFLKK
jgi:CubicO group peptidase (beta-lactamase class C family)